MNWCDKTPKWCDGAPFFILSGFLLGETWVTAPAGGGIRQLGEKKRPFTVNLSKKTIIGLGFAFMFIRFSLILYRGFINT
jgi:hypothetical protein